MDLGYTLRIACIASRSESTGASEGTTCRLAATTAVRATAWLLLSGNLLAFNWSPLDDAPFYLSFAASLSCCFTSGTVFEAHCLSGVLSPFLAY
jgi:hypothetical protein